LQHRPAERAESAKIINVPSPYYHFIVSASSTFNVAVTKKNDRDYPTAASRGNDHDEEDEYLAVHLIQVPGKCDEAQVRGIQHQFQT
jgi:hypothetical protein